MRKMFTGTMTSIMFQMPSGWEPYLRSNFVENDVPIGGVYEWYNGYVTTAVMPVGDWNHVPDIWLTIKQKHDDGNLDPQARQSLSVRHS